jgi:hypothetical protein
MGIQSRFKGCDRYLLQLFKGSWPLLVSGMFPSSFPIT